jgi:hypothetical protein
VRVLVLPARHCRRRPRRCPPVVVEAVAAADPAALAALCEPLVAIPASEGAPFRVFNLDRFRVQLMQGVELTSLDHRGASGDQQRENADSGADGKIAEVEGAAEQNFLIAGRFLSMVVFYTSH